MNMDSKLFPPELLKAAEMLVPIPENGGAAFSTGPHRSPSRGDSPEFQDYRSYTPGDDLRRLDWNIFRRFRKLLVRQYRNFPQKKHLIILDDSKSIRFREERALLVWRLAALIGGVLLCHGESVVIQTGENTRRVHIGPGKQSMVPLIGELSAGYHTKFCGPQLSFRLPEGYHSWVISDFMDPRGLDHLEKQLKKARGFTPVQIYEDGDLSPEINAETQLIDAESGAEILVTPTRAMRERFRERVIYFERLLTRSAGLIHSRRYIFNTKLSVPQLIRQCAEDLFQGERQ